MWILKYFSIKITDGGEKTKSQKMFNIYKNILNIRNFNKIDVVILFERLLQASIFTHVI